MADERTHLEAGKSGMKRFEHITAVMGGRSGGAGWIVLAALLLTTGCRPSDRDLAEQQALQRHQQEVEIRNTVVKDMRGPNAAMIEAGARWLYALKQSGHLPGLTQEDVVRFTSEKTVASTSGPWLLTVELHLISRASPPKRRGYLLVQNCANADFQLLKAWSTDAAGKEQETYPVEPAPVRADPRRTFLGPVNPGAETGFYFWYHGAQGTAWVTVAGDDSAAGFHHFEIGNTNTIAGTTNHADLRSETFSLGPPGKNRGPFTFSFAYKLPGPVKPGDNLDVDVRFFGPGEGNFIGQEVYHVGDSSGDSAMTQYKTQTIDNIVPPRGAVKADVWVVANMGGPWTSGVGQFDSFSVTVANPRSRAEILLWAEIPVAMAAALGVAFLVWQSLRRPKPVLGK